VTARERLLAQEAYNSRSFPLITEEALAEVEREAVAATLAELRTTVEAALNELGVPGEGYPAPVANAVDILRAALDLIDKAGQP
jgi:hypothetical protein